MKSGYEVKEQAGFLMVDGQITNLIYNDHCRTVDPVQPELALAGDLLCLQKLNQSGHCYQTDFIAFLGGLIP